MKLALFLALAAAPPPLPLTLEQAGSRRPSDSAPVYEGKAIAVEGQVSAPPIRLYATGYAHLGIQDNRHGLVLEGPVDSFDGLRPGVWVRVEGTLGRRAGLAVLRPQRIVRRGQGTPPFPSPAELADLQSFRLLGRRITAELTISEIGENSGGVYFNAGPASNPLKVFAPFPAPAAEWRFSGLKTGDRVRVTGLASQYCPVPPFNKRFQVLIHSPSDVTLVHSGWALPPWVIALIAATAVASVVLLWRREVRHRRQRELLRQVYEMGEEILSASTVAEVLQSIGRSAPRVFDITGVCLYVYNRSARTLEAICEHTEPCPPVSVDTASKGIEAGVVSCFRNRALLSIPDAARSPFAPEPESRCAFRSLLLIPMFAQGESCGVLELGHASAVRNFSSVEKLVAQHLATQIGVAVKLLEQRSIREQLFRTEKVAAVGRLITGVVNELQAPLATVASLSRQLPPPALAAQHLEAIHAEAARAAAIVNRLVSFDRPEHVGSGPLDLNRLLRSLMEFRELEWKARGIHVGNFLRDGPLFVVGAQGQLEQVFLSLLVYAEQALADAPEKSISIGSNLIAKRVLAEISFSSASGNSDDPFGQSGEQPGALDLRVCRGIIAGHEGEIRLTRARASESRFEIELPWAPADAEVRTLQPRSAAGRPRQITALIMDSDEQSQRQFMKLLTARACRVVPARSSEEGLELAQRMRFDVALCSSRLPGLNWIELLQRTRDKVGAFVLLTDGFDAQLTAEAGRERYFVLPKPVQESRLDYILDHLSDPAAHQAIA
jgi:signal transduction histidine kinase